MGYFNICFQVYNFELTADDMQRIAGLSRGIRAYKEPM